MENPPDLIVVIASDEQYQDKKKLIIENINQERDKQCDELIENLQSDKYALEYQLERLRAQLTVRNNYEFDEQSRLLQQRFQDEIQSIIHRHTELVQHTINDLSGYVTNVLRKSIEDIESLRLLHQKELCTHSKIITDCIQQQSNEMNELSHHLIIQQHTMPMSLFNKLIDDFRTSLNDLKTSFDSKINYLSDIHSSTIDKLNTKHEIEINEMKCELNLMSNRSN
ncbi:unnamed protein product [Rotaria sp. Silwood2]|nr:unnamed protein product [Rotaria sp. Silwood2]CAF2640404.1 unnamed protein product [Rotaria sp. Silwood2]CAF2843971.1 unnamed protein product [Rotaria sp. Silwood2]CAF3986722.1 unnamed protein product [Rotaria sp. Silwood2]CAF4116574.1 unnamed protein product [Rotaria sp. Silwood2]